MAQKIIVQDGNVVYSTSDPALEINFNIGGQLTVTKDLYVGDNTTTGGTITTYAGQDLTLTTGIGGNLKLSPSNAIILNNVAWPTGILSATPGQYLGVSSLNTLGFLPFVLPVSILPPIATPAFSDNLTSSDLNYYYPNARPGQSAFGPTVLYPCISAGTWRKSTGAVGTLSSVNASGGTTGMSFSGGPITSSGTLTLQGTLGIANGGTGQTNSVSAFNALAPVQSSHAGNFLTTDGTNSFWSTLGSVSIYQPVTVATLGDTVLSGLQTIDGVSVAIGQRVLVHLQLNTSENGIYIVQSGGWIRSNDWALGAIRYSGTQLFSLSGNTFMQTIFTLFASASSVVVGTDPYTFSPSISNGSGLNYALDISRGGTGSITATAAVNALVPVQGPHASQFLTTDGTSVSWGVPSQPLNQIVFGTGSALSSDPAFTYVTGSGLLTVGSVTSNTYQSVAAQTMSITASANLLLMATSGYIQVGSPVRVNGSVGTSGQILVSQGAGTPPLWSSVISSLGYTPVNQAGDNMFGYLILNADPIAPLGAATKQYVDNVASGVNIHPACESSTTSSLPSAVYNNGSGGVGATLTATSNASINTVAPGGYAGLSVNSRILVKNQASQLQNGIYTVTTIGVDDPSGSPWVLTRASDFDGTPTTEVVSGALTFVQNGTLSGTQWVQTSTGTGHNVSPSYNYVVVGTDPIIFSQFSGAGTYTSGPGINISSNVISNTGVISLTTNTGLSTNVSAMGNVSITNTGVVSVLAGTGISLSGSTGTVTINTSAIPNSSLVNSSITLGSTSIALGSTSTTLAGLTSVTSTTFVGSLNGNATSATNIAGGAAGSVPYQTALNTTTLLAAGSSNQVLISGAVPAWTNTPVLTGTNFTGIPNTGLTNSSVTLGSTNVALGATATTIAGLTSVTSTTFVGALNGNATTATTATNVVGGAAGSVPYQTGANTTSMLVAGSSNQVLVSGTTPSWTNAPVLTGTNFTGIPNSAFVNNSITIGSTSIALGSTSTTLSGLTFVTSTNFTGALSGNATSATNIIGGTAGNIAYQSASNTTAFVTNAAGVLQAATSGAVPVWTATPTLTGTNFTGIPNAGLTNSSITIGSTSIALGATSAVLAGLASVTATTFAGALVGNASTATTAGTVTTAAQPAITSVGTLTSLTVSGNTTTNGYVIRSVSASVTATGTTLGTAASLASDINVISTVASNTGVALPGIAGTTITVINTGANSLNVYPATLSGIIDNASAGSPYILQVGAKLMFTCVSGTQWYTLNATYS